MERTSTFSPYGRVKAEMSSLCGKLKNHQVQPYMANNKEELVTNLS